MEALALQVKCELQGVGLHQLQDLEPPQHSGPVLEDVLGWLVGEALESLDPDGQVLLLLFGELNSIADLFHDLVMQDLVPRAFEFQPSAVVRLVDGLLLLLFLDALALGLALPVLLLLLFGQFGPG